MWRLLLATSVMAEPESRRFLQRRAEDSTPTCGGIELEPNDLCRDTVLWAAGGGKWDARAVDWFKNFESIAGVPIGSGNVADYQRLYWCAPPGGKYCGLPPCSGCSSPPCDDCFAGKPLVANLRPGCEANDTSIGCIPPETTMGYKGQHWPTTYIDGTQEMHIFLIGDWGGLDGSLDTNQGRPELIAYNWGRQPGPSVFPRSRWNKRHTEQLCSHKEFVECFNTFGEAPCIPECGFVMGVDDKPQLLVAEAFKARAALKDPQYILNVGDNFYWGGIEKTCGFPMNMLSYPAKHQFDEIFEGIYQGPGLSGKPWFGVLGNHDWGGFRFDNGHIFLLGLGRKLRGGKMQSYAKLVVGGSSLWILPRLWETQVRTAAGLATNSLGSPLDGDVSDASDYDEGDAHHTNDHPSPLCPFWIIVDPNWHPLASLDTIHI